MGREGVSPVVATVLMVAITVVLAGTLYAIISSYIIPRTGVNPFVALGEPQASGDGNWTVEVTQAAQDEPLQEYSVVLLANSTDPILRADLRNPGLVALVPPISINLVDLAGDRRLNGGDRFVLAGLQAGTTYELSLLFRGEQVAKSSPITP